MTTTESLSIPAPAAEPVGRSTSERAVLLAAAISGILYFVLAWARPPDGPAVETATAAQIRVFLVENLTSLRLGAFVAVLAIPTVLVFTVSLARLVRIRMPGSVLADLITGGGHPRRGPALARRRHGFDDAGPGLGRNGSGDS
jgi:hypothetical protein